MLIKLSAAVSPIKSTVRENSHREEMSTTSLNSRHSSSSARASLSLRGEGGWGEMTRRGSNAVRTTLMRAALADVGGKLSRMVTAHVRGRGPNPPVCRARGGGHV